MAGRPGRSGRRRRDPGSPLVDLDRVFADDRFIDRIASSPWGAVERKMVAADSAGRRDASGTYGELAMADPLADLFETWRAELASEPIPPLVSVRSTLVAAAPPAKPRAKRSLRPALAIAAAIAALLVGTATVGSKDAQPGSALWTVTQVVWPDRVASVNSRNDVRNAITEASQAINDGRSRDAQRALIKATEALGKVDDVDVGDMRQQLDALWDRTTTQNRPTSVIPDPTVDAPSSSDGPTAPSPTTPIVPAPPAATVAPTSDPPPADLAVGAVGAPAQDPAPIVLPPAAGAVAAVIPSSSDSVAESSTPAPSSSDPVTASPTPTPTSDPTTSGGTTTLPAPVPVDPTTEPSLPTTAAQIAPANSAPIPPPAQSSTADPTTQGTQSTDPGGLSGSTGTTAGTAQ